MKIYRIPYMDQFECAKGDCPLTCCKGWQIPIDPESEQKYKNQKGQIGLKLRFLMRQKDGYFVFNKNASTCAFFTKDGLCSLQCSKGHDMLPGICRRFPRRFKNYGYLCEELLELACPIAAELFLENDTDYILVDEEVSYPDTSENDDEIYLNRLLLTRDQIFDFLSANARDLASFFATLKSLERYGQDLQIHCAINGAMEATPNLSAISVHDYAIVHDAASLQLIPLYDITSTDAIICSGTYHSNQKTRLPLLYEVCRLYFESFDTLTPEAGNRRLNTLFDDFITRNPKALNYLVKYYRYYLQSNFLYTYEDYSFLKIFALGNMHVHLLLLFFALYEEKYHSFTASECAKLIASYDRHMRHNEDVLTDLFKILPKPV